MTGSLTDRAKLQRFFRYGLCAQLGAVILIATGAYLGVVPTVLPSLPHSDLLAHAGLIGLLAFFVDGAMGHRPMLQGRPFPRLAPVLVLVAAGVEEYAQRFSSRRTSSLEDFAADVVGVCAFSWLSKRLADATMPTTGASPGGPDPCKVPPQT